MVNKTVKHLTLLFILPFIVVIISLCCGRYMISPADVFASLLSFFDNGPITTYESVVINIRLPRIILGAMVGIGLAVAGATFQSAFSNPLASPDVIGVSSGAAFGAVIGIMAGFSPISIQLTALVMGLFAIALVYALCRASHTDSILMIVLAGIIVAGVFTALISLMKFVADPLTQLPDIVYWLMGSLTGASYSKIGIALPFLVIGLIIITMMKWRLNVISLSDEEMRALGHNPRYLRWTFIIAATMLVATCVSICGQIGWIGLVIPHVARLLVGSDNRLVIPFSASLGVTFVVAVDTVCRSAVEAEIPLSIMTALIGAPIFAILFIRRGRAWR